MFRKVWCFARSLYHKNIFIFAFLRISVFIFSSWWWSIPLWFIYILQKNLINTTPKFDQKPIFIILSGDGYHGNRYFSYIDVKVRSSKFSTRSRRSFEWNVISFFFSSVIAELEIGLLLFVNSCINLDEWCMYVKRIIWDCCHSDGTNIQSYLFLVIHWNTCPISKASMELAKTRKKLT